MGATAFTNLLVRLGTSALNEGIDYFSREDSYAPKATIVLVGIVALPIILNTCLKSKKNEPEVEDVVHTNTNWLNETHPDKIFLSPARYVEMPEGQEVTVCKWTFKKDSREVSVIRTIQRDLICQVFNRSNGLNSRSYIGQRGAYKEKEAEEFVTNRVPRLFSARNRNVGSAVFLGLNDLTVCTWNTKLHEILLVHNTENDNTDWVVFFINEKKFERFPTGMGKKILPYIDDLERETPKVESDANEVVSVSFPKFRFPKPDRPIEAQNRAAGPRRAMASDFVENLEAIQFENVYVDNIPVKQAKKNNKNVVLGYFQDDRFYSDWFYAPFPDGSVPQIDGNEMSSYCSSWRSKPLISPDSLFGIKREQGVNKNGDLKYESSADHINRKYYLVPANDGWVPVRHPTDPQCGNWVSKETIIKTVYDSNRVRWPACDKIDYPAHGFVYYEESNAWWPKKNGPYKHSFLRLKEPYHPLYQQIDRDSEHLWMNAQKIGAVALAYIMVNYGEAKNVLETVMNGAAGLVEGFKILEPLANQEHRKNELAQGRAIREHTTQKEVVDALAQQDIYDRGEEVVKSVIKGDFDRINELLTEGEIIPSEVRGLAVVLAAKYGHLNILIRLFDKAAINAEFLRLAEKEAKENYHSSVVFAIRKYRNREIPGPI